MTSRSNNKIERHFFYTKQKYFKKSFFVSQQQNFFMQQNMKFFLQQKCKSIKNWTQLSNPVPENKIQKYKI